MTTLKTLSVSIVLGVSLLFVNTAEAASFFFTPATGTFGVGKTITVDLKIDSEGVGMNAAQATLRFPKETLQVTSVDKTSSAFNFWLTEPTFSNQDGVISFVGGTPYGISGASMQVVRIVFTSKGSGPAPITVVDAAITASDGSGTNILSKTNDANLTISSTTTTAVAPIVVVAPAQIVREVVPASSLPTRPVLSVPLYPDQASWYNVNNIFTASWDLPRDITGINTAVNKQPNFTPAENSEGLFDNKMFDAPTEGAWYLHVRFRNSAGWGTSAHYRIAVDTNPPLPFDITSPESDKGDTPSQTLQFKTSDAISGLSTYQIKTNNEDWVTIPAKDFNGAHQIFFKEPGKHHIIVKAVDQAGNSIENSIDREVTPIASPTFTFISKEIFSDEPIGLSVKGTALPDTSILLLLKLGASTISTSTAPVNNQGNWEHTFNDPLRNGTYFVSIQNKDARGALSLIVNSPTISVTGKYTTVIFISFILLIGTVVAGIWYYRKRRAQTALRIEVAGSDASKVFKMIESDIEKLNTARNTPTPADDEFIIKKMQENVKKMSGYIEEEIDKAKK